MGNPYNGYSWKERDDKFKEMNKRIASDTSDTSDTSDKLSPASGPCALCGDPKAAVEYHDEDYSVPYSWSEPAAYAVCRYCHIFQLHMRFTRPVSWQAFLAHVRRGGYASDLKDPEIKNEVEAARFAIRNGSQAVLRELRPYNRTVGEEWFARLRLDSESLTDEKARLRP